MFPKIGVPQHGWFITENPIKMDNLGVPLFSETSIYNLHNQDFCHCSNMQPLPKPSGPPRPLRLMSWASDPFQRWLKKNKFLQLLCFFTYFWCFFDSKLDVSPVATGKKISKFRSFPRVFPILGYPTVGIIFIHFWHKRSNHSHQSWVERQSGQPEVLSFFGFSLH